MRISIIAALAAATAACGSAGRNEGAPADANAPEPAGNRVASLSEGQRNAVFIRAIRDAGLECQHVERSVPAGSAGTLPVWRATCQSGVDYMIAIGADGGAQVMPEPGAGGNRQ